MEFLPYCFLIVVMATTTSALELDTRVLNFQIDTDTNHAQQTNFKPTDDPNRGYVQNCAASGTYFNISWTPKDISPTKQLRFDADLISPIFFDKGKVTGSLLFEGTPMLTINKEITCDEISAMISRLIPSRTPLFVCPLKIGQRILGTVIFSQTERLIGYDGQYVLKGYLYDTEGRQLLCMQIDVTILPY